MADEKPFEKTLQKLKFIFYRNGVLFENNINPNKNRWVAAIYFFDCIWVGIDIVASLFFFIPGIMEGKSLLDLTVSAPCLVYSVLSVFKGYSMFRGQDKIREMFSKIRHFENEHGCHSEDIGKKDREFLHKIIARSNNLNRLLSITFVVDPLFIICHQYYKTKEIDLVLPILAEYPFDCKDVRVWPFVFLHQLWSICIVIINTLAADYMVYTSCAYLGIQFKMLSDEISRMVDVGHERGPDYAFRMNFPRLVRWHQQSIRSVADLEIILSQALLFNFVCSSLLLCLTGFNVTAEPQMGNTMKFLFFLLANLLEIYTICHFGDHLMTSSMKVGEAVYCCKWYSLQPSSQKALLIILARAQTPCKLTAFGFATVGLSAFMSILSTAWSYFTLLKTSYGFTREN